MKIVKLDYELSVCKIKSLDNDIISKDFYFIGKTQNELSIVCETRYVPTNVINREDGFRGFYIDGTLDFSLVGILAKISQILANNKISIFAISTYNTDYILVKKDKYELAIGLLKSSGFKVDE